MAKYQKFFAALAGVAVLAATELLGADSAWVAVVVSVLTALGVYAAPNKAE